MIEMVYPMPPKRQPKADWERGYQDGLPPNIQWPEIRQPEPKGGRGPIPEWKR
jgi:hypothetical protein